MKNSLGGTELISYAGVCFIERANMLTDAGLWVFCDQVFRI
jgi:hypothetical protein